MFCKEKIDVGHDCYFEDNVYIVVVVVVFVFVVVVVVNLFTFFPVQMKILENWPRYG